MFTLLPTAQKERLSKEYRLRAATLVVAVVAIAVFVSCVLLFPAYIVSNVKVKEAVARKQALESSTLFAEKANLRQTVASVQQELAAVGTEDVSATSIIDDIQKAKPAGIRLFHIEYQHAPSAGVLILNGRASTRQVLLDYKKVLEDDPQLEEVSFPVSDLSKSFDIEFTLTIRGKF